MTGGEASGDEPLVVAIDGPVGVGKSSVARRLAERLGVPYLETGAMYRAVGLVVHDAGIDPDDREAVERKAGEIDLGMRRTGRGRIQVLLAGEPLPDRIRDPEVSEVTSRSAAYPGVRKRMVELQRRWASEQGAVVEGRDIGSRVFPDTPHKFYLDARPEVRVERRLEQLRAAGRHDVPRERIAADVRSRDERDSQREDSPLGYDDTYIVVDSSDLDLEQVVDAMVREIERRRATATG